MIICRYDAFNNIVFEKRIILRKNNKVNSDTAVYCYGLLKRFGKKAFGALMFAVIFIIMLLSMIGGIGCNRRKNVVRMLNSMRRNAYLRKY